MSPCFHRLWRCTAALGALDATIRSAITMRPLCPLNQSPRPTGCAVARTWVGKGLAGETEHRSLGISAGEPNFSRVLGGGRGHCHRCRFHLVLSPVPSAGPCRLPIAPPPPGEAGGIGASESAVGLDSDDGQV